MSHQICAPDRTDKGADRGCCCNPGLTTSGGSRALGLEDLLRACVRHSLCVFITHSLQPCVVHVFVHAAENACAHLSCVSALRDRYEQIARGGSIGYPQGLTGSRLVGLVGLLHMPPESVSGKVPGWVRASQKPAPRSSLCLTQGMSMCRSSNIFACPSFADNCALATGSGKRPDAYRLRFIHPTHRI